MEFAPESYDTVGEVVDELSELQSRQSLSKTDEFWLRSGRNSLERGLARESLFRPPLPTYSGSFSGDSFEELLAKILENSPYTWRQTSETFVIYPRESSRLQYPVTLEAAQGETIGEILNTIMEQDPHADKGSRHLKLPNKRLAKKGGNHEEDLYAIGVSSKLSIDNVSAMESLTRVVELTGPRVRWIVSPAGALEQEPPRPLLVGIVGQ